MVPIRYSFPTLTHLYRQAQPVKGGRVVSRQDLRAGAQKPPPKPTRKLATLKGQMKTAAKAGKSKPGKPATKKPQGGGKSKGKGKGKAKA